jgi:hypothetical protein
VLKRRLRSFVCVDLVLGYIWEEPDNLNAIDIDRFGVAASARHLLRGPCSASEQCSGSEQGHFDQVDSAQHG